MRTTQPLCLFVLLAGTATGQPSRSVMHTDMSGVRVLAQRSAVSYEAATNPSHVGTLLWTYEDLASIPKAQVSSEINADGTLFVAATWGDQFNADC